MEKSVAVLFNSSYDGIHIAPVDPAKIGDFP
jgi:hypothetical protein